MQTLIEEANSHSLLGLGKLSTIAACLERVAFLPGATAEVGVYKGGSARLIARSAPHRCCYLFDTFEGIPQSNAVDVHKVGDFADTSLRAVEAFLSDCPNAQFRQGYFPSTAYTLEDETFAFVHIDGDQYQTTKDALGWFYPRLVDGGILLFDDFQWQNCPGVERALTEYSKAHDLSFTSPHPHQAMLVKGEPPAFDLCLSATGIGDSICGLYATCGLAERLKIEGIQKMVRLHTGHPGWFARVSHPGVEVVAGTGIGVDMNRDYIAQLTHADDRKQWYCDATADLLPMEPFTPVAPAHVDNSVHGLFALPLAPYVLVSPFSNYRTREWADTSWRYLSHLLDQNGIRLVAVGTSHQGTRLQELFGSCSATTQWFLGLNESSVAELMCGALCFIGIDSGMSHFAGLLQVPSIAIHAQLPDRFLWSQTNIISLMPEKNTTCSPCRYQSGTYVAHCDSGCSAMTSVTPHQVLNHVLGFLRGGDT